MIRHAIGAYVFDGYRIKKNIAISYTAEGEIICLAPWDGTETPNTVHYSGLLMPGFVNAHCHLELSHLRAKIPTQAGMSEFVKQVVTKRKAPLDEIENACKMADSAMYRNGISVVGDIANTLDSRSTKLQSKIFYHSFIECFGLREQDANSIFENAHQIENQFSPLQSSVTQHAPYSVSNRLFGLISEYAQQNDAILSIHNQESQDEQDLFLKGSGALYHHFSQIGLPLHEKTSCAISPLQQITQFLPHTGSVLFVHNTFTSETDIDFLRAHRPLLDVSFCLCPQSNLYITQTAPPIDLFYRKEQNICIGTDSLASNTSVSILAELQNIQKLAPHIPLATILQWASFNGAKALQCNKQFGSFEPHKTPGIIQLAPLNIKDFTLLPETQIRRIM